MDYKTIGQPTKIHNMSFYNCDCMELLKETPDKYYELAIVDPPYGIDITSECMGGRNTIKPDKTKNWDNAIPTKEYFNELFRVSKNQIIWGGNYFSLPVSRYFAIWDKGETMYGRDFAECELAWSSGGGTRIFKLNPNQLDRIHPTQKPVALYKWLLKNYAKEGDKILDTHLGSMSICIAIHQMNTESNMKLTLTGTELDAEYFKAGVERVGNQTRQNSLFDK